MGAPQHAVRLRGFIRGAGVDIKKNCFAVLDIDPTRIFFLEMHEALTQWRKVCGAVRRDLYTHSIQRE